MTAELSPELTVAMVSYNTCALTITAIETLMANAGDVAMDIVVWDNASADGSAEAIAARFPQIEVIRSPDNIGFAAANNRIAERVQTGWLLLLNPDTETHPKAIENLLTFAKASPQAGIVGGRTVFPDGSLNVASCWNRMTIWSLFCSAAGLSRAFPGSALFNSAAIGGSRRDSVREVDIVVGCFFLIRTDLWRALGGFDERYFMYGEEADLCLRARRLGYRPMITPDAQIMHMVGASTKQHEDKVVQLLRAKSTLVRDHWSGWARPVGIALLWWWSANRKMASGMAQLAGRSPRQSLRSTMWREVWRRRRDWLSGY